MAGAASPAGAAERINRGDEDSSRQSLRDNQGPMVDKWVHPVYPPELKGAKVRAGARIRFVVDETGALVTPEAIGGDERFHAAALAAISQWKFQPALRAGKPKPTSLEVTFSFSPAGPPKSYGTLNPPYPVESSPLQPPREKSAPDPAYPQHLVARKFFGEVELVLGINAAGRVNGVEVLRSTHPDLLAAAFTTVEGWQFQPAMRGRVPDVGEQRAVLTFRVEEEETGRVVRNDWMELNGITLREPGAPKTADFFTEVPKPQVFVDPVFPDELLQAGTEGDARVDFSVGKDGSTTAISVIEASAPEFGAALAAAVATWKLEPLYRAGEKVWADFSVTWKFAKPSAANTTPDMLAALRHPEARAKPKELDRRLTPIFLLPVVCAEATSADNAEIEVTINRAGRVCWPKVIKASTAAYGWAAATAVSQWYFETPLKDGKPADVRVIIPVRQAAP